MSRCLALLMLLLPLAELVAQPRAAPPVIDIGFGLGRGLGGRDLASRTLLSGALMASRPVYDFDRSALVASANISGNVVWDRPKCVGAQLAECSVYPSDISVSALAGWAKRHDQLTSLRVLAGPTFFTATDSRRGFGITSRIDYARPVTSRISFVVWAQSQLQPVVGREHKTWQSAGVGERLHVATMGIGVRTLRIAQLPRRPSAPEPFGAPVFPPN